MTPDTKSLITHRMLEERYSGVLVEFFEPNL
jgi:hypothetical protein